MRSIAVILLSAAAFGAFLYVNHRRAADLVANERVAVDRLRAYARESDRTPLEEGGYRFRWNLEGPLPALAVAGPVEREKTGMRWFACVPGEGEIDVYEFDTVLNRAPGNVPDLEALRAFLARPPDERNEENRPFGWRRVLRP